MVALQICWLGNVRNVSVYCSPLYLVCYVLYVVCTVQVPRSWEM
jgi:hypothetical protein